jgi:PAS domain S-box-containing protein
MRLSPREFVQRKHARDPGTPGSTSIGRGGSGGSPLRAQRLLTATAARPRRRGIARAVDLASPMQTQQHLYQYPEFWITVAAIGFVAGTLVLLGGLRVLSQRRLFGRYAAIVDGAPDALSLVDRQYVYILANQEYERRSGLTRQQVAGRTVVEVMGAKAFQSLIKPNLDRALAGESILYEAWFDFAATGRRRMLVNYTPYRERLGSGTIDGVLVSARDVTELREAEDARRSAEIQFRDLLDHSPSIVCIKDLQRRFLMINRAAEKLLHIRREDVLGKTAEQALSPAVVTAMGSLDQQVLETQQPGTEEQTLSNVGNEDRTLLSTVFLLRDHAGKSNALCTIALDISERKQARRALEVALAKYRTLFNEFPLGILVTDAEGRILELNAASQLLMGAATTLKPGDHIHQLRSLLLRPDGTSMSMQDYPIAVALREQRAVSVDELGLRRGDGGITWLSLTAAPLPVPGYGIVAACQDVTAQRRARDAQLRAAALRDSERRFRTMADGLSSLIWVTDATGKLAFVNQRYLEFFGLEPDAVEGSAWNTLVHPEDLPLLTDKFGAGLRSLRPFSVQCRLRRADGEWRWLESYARPHWSETRQFEGLVGSSRDITRRKRVEQALRCSRRELKQRSAQLGRLAAELTRVEQSERRRLGELLHDHLQQLLVGASLSTSRVARRLNARGGGEGGRELERIASLLDEAIEASRTLMADLCPPILYEAGLTDALNWLARSMHDKHGLTVTLDLDSTVSIADETLRVFLFESVREALFNVVKHAGVLRARVALRRNDATSLRLLVIDAGVGFDADSAHAREAWSDGLGLVAMRERMRLLGGRLQVESMPEQGTTISLFAPLAPETDIAAVEAAAPALPLPAEPPQAVEPPLDVGILLVDDHLVMRDGLSALLEEEDGVTVVGQASNGREAIEQVEALRPDLILMDFSMPVMDGVEATRIIHQRWPGIPVIGLSFYQEADRAAAMREAGAVDYICKTSVTDDLLDKIRQHASKGSVAPPESRSDA